MSRSTATTNLPPMASKVASANKARINIIYYSMYGHVATCKFSFKMVEIIFSINSLFPSGQIGIKRR
jgi:hypothetical protein